MFSPSPNLNPNERTFVVFRRVNGIIRVLGNVRAISGTHADKKAIGLFGSGTWTKEKEDA